MESVKYSAVSTEAPLTHEELIRCAAAVTHYLQQYAAGRPDHKEQPLWREYKALQLRLFLLGAEGEATS